MKELLERLKLIQHFTIEIEAEKSDFVKKLMERVDEGSTGTFFSAFEAFDSSKNEYKGTARSDGFKIRRRRKFFDMNLNLAIAKGSYRQKDNLLLIDTEIYGFHGMLIPFYIFVPIFYVIGIIVFLTTDNPPQPWFVFPFIVVHAVFMLGIPYLIMRKGVNRMKYDLERDLFFIAKR
jgi:hypothetical protein